MSSLHLERDGPLLRVTMARPERRNAFDAALIGELTKAFADVGDARAVLLAGDGPSFSAGADVEWMRSSADLSYDENVADALRLRAMLDAIDGCPAPVIARVQGHALGGGCGLVACSDVVVAEPEAQFAFSEVKLGIVPAVISPFALAKIGPGAARRYFVTGERFGAVVALRIGLVHEVADDLDAAVERVVADVLSAGPAAARAAKELARGPLAADETARRIAAHRTSEEGQEGLRAFLEKRPPRWRQTQSRYQTESK
ncbi:MAG: enoyl-CoA hydratase-related protein [Gaiellaceae bacterium]